MRTYKPHARVAGRTSQRIDGVDGVPTTHTQRGWGHAWTVTDGPDTAAPCPFAASRISAAVAVPVMLAVVLIATAAALLSVTAGHPDQPRLVALTFGAIGAGCVLMTMPAAIRAICRLTRSGRRAR